MHTAQHLVTHCLSGELARNRTIILVTHHISLCLPVASHIVELGHGKVLREGSVKKFEESGTLQKVVEEEDEPFPSETEDDSPALAGENEADTLLKDIVSPRTRKIGNGKLIEAEARAEGRVSLQTYLTYIRAAGLLSWALILILMLFIRFINIGNQVQLVFIHSLA